MVDRSVRIIQRSARRTTLRTPPVRRRPADEEIRAAAGIPSREAMACLQRLAELHREGVLSCDEFVTAKNGILGLPSRRSSDDRAAPE
jgi:hypothetical protein